MKGRLAAGLAVLALLLGGVVANGPATTTVTSTRTALVPVAQVASVYPPGWQVRLHQFSWFSTPPSAYDFNLLNYMVPGSANTMTYCINIGGNWPDLTQAVTMNAPGVLHVWSTWGCEGGGGTEVTTPTCLTSTMCFQQKTCDYWAWGAFRYGPWTNFNGANCQITSGQPNSFRWNRWK